jgi:hypothetical protein
MSHRLCAIAAALLLSTAGELSASDFPAIITSVSSHGVGPVSITPSGDGYDANLGDWPSVARFGCSFLYVDVDVRDGGTITGTYRVQQSPFSDSYLDIYLIEPGATFDPGTTWNESGTERCFRRDFPPGVVSIEPPVDAWSYQPGWITPEFALSVPVSAYAHQTVRIVFRQWSWGEFYNEAIQSRIHLNGQRSLYIRAALNTDQPAPQEGVVLPTQARVPLGGYLRVEAIDGPNGNPLPATFVLNSATVAPGLAPQTLFRNSALIQYTGEPIHQTTFHAVHKGQVTLTITPSDASIPSGTLTVIVEDPLRVGSTANDLDDEIGMVAHATGILPQFVKAHIEQESRFDRKAFRYEPLSRWVGDLGAISRGNNYRTQTPFQDYRLATAADTVNGILAQGLFMLNDDRDARTGLNIGCAANGTGGRPILPTDSLISATDIVRCNDARMHWVANAGAQGPSRARQLQTDPFTAQTALASSFGLMQVMYTIAVIDLNWSGNASSRKNPSFLFDTSANHAQQLGSVRLGSQIDVRNFNRTLRRAGGNIPTADVLLLLFNDAWQLYNPGKPGYGALVASKVPQHVPVASHPVLGGN